MFAPIRWLGLSVVKVAISVAAGGGVTLLAIGTLAMLDQERWDYHALDNIGPPIGPMLLSIGAGLATAGGSLYALFFPTAPQTGRYGYWPSPQAAGPGRT